MAENIKEKIVDTLVQMPTRLYSSSCILADTADVNSDQSIQSINFLPKKVRRSCLLHVLCTFYSTLIRKACGLLMHLRLSK